MRDILFRGKRVDNGEWVYGSFIPDLCELLYGDKLDGFIKPFGKIRKERLMVEVDRKTVGQYTGLTDKNGKKIFEGDILEGDLEDSLDPGAKWRSEVIWGKFGWNCKGNKISLPMDECDIREGEGIGNIHDNPELLKGSAKNE